MVVMSGEGRTSLAKRGDMSLQGQFFADDCGEFDAYVRKTLLAAKNPKSTSSFTSSMA